MTAEHEAARIRDVPASCICDWHYDYRAHRWVPTFGGWRDGCPWHGGKAA